jgi:hypothetical protein
MSVQTKLFINFFLVILYINSFAECKTAYVTTYCQNYQRNYDYYCTSGLDNFSNTRDFCQAFSKNCINSPPANNQNQNKAQSQQARTNPPQQQQWSSTYRTKPTPRPKPTHRPKNVPQQSGSGGAGSGSGVASAQINKECEDKRALGEQYCHGNEPANIRSQCDQYRQYCVNGNTQQIDEMCTKHQNLAQTYCTGNEGPAIREKCDLYRKYCVGQNSAPQQPTGPVVNVG